MAKFDRRSSDSGRQSSALWCWPMPKGLRERHVAMYQLFMWVYLGALGCHLAYFALLGLQPYPIPVIINVIGTLANVLSIYLHRKGRISAALLVLVIPVSVKAVIWEYLFGDDGGFEYFHIAVILFICIAPISRVIRLIFSGLLLCLYFGSLYLVRPLYLVSHEFLAMASISNLIISVVFIAIVAIQMGWEAEQREQRYRRDLRHDQLTGALSRLALLEEGIRLLRRDGLGLLMIDVDHFKVVNDTYGHAMGDEVLIEMTQRLKHHLRGSDQLCRQGGGGIRCSMPQ